MKLWLGPSCKCNFYSYEEFTRKSDEDYVKPLMYFQSVFELY